MVWLGRSRSVEIDWTSQKFSREHEISIPIPSPGRSSFSLIFSRGQLLLSCFVEAGRINPSQIRWRPRDQFSLRLRLSSLVFLSFSLSHRETVPPLAFNEPGCRVLGVSRWFSWRYPTAIWCRGNVLALSPINPSPQDHSRLQICARPSTVAVKTPLRIFFSYRPPLNDASVYTYTYVEFAKLLRQEKMVLRDVQKKYRRRKVSFSAEILLLFLSF